MRSNTIVRTATLVSALLVVSGRALIAQDQPAVFNHGVLSGGYTWQYHGDYIASRLALLPLRPDRNWLARLNDQATEINTALLNNGNFASATGMPFAGHSLGGIASRTYSRNYPGRVNRIVTVGTPHFGAPTARLWNTPSQYGYGNAIEDIVVPMASQIWDPVWYFLLVDNVPGQIVDWAAQMVLWWENTAGLICRYQGFCEYIFTRITAPFVFDIDPAGAFLNGPDGLNSQNNLDREQNTFASGSSRVGYWTQASPWNTPFYLLGGGDIGVIFRYALLSWYINQYHHYGHDGDYDHEDNAYLWLQGAEQLALMDAAWQYLIGALIDYQLTYYYDDYPIVYMTVHPSDGFIPFYSAQYPRGTRNAQIAGDILHTEQMSSSTVRDALYSTFHDEFGVPVRSPPPQGPLSDVILEGLSEARSGLPADWYAYPVGGSEPYRYQWSVDGTVVQDGPSNSMQWTFYGAYTEHEVYVTVWDATGANRSGGMLVYIQP